MTKKVVDLYEYFNIPKLEGARAEITTYLKEDNLEKPTVLIIPGGAYTHIGERETEPVALKYYENGYNVLVLRYSLVPLGYPTQLIEGCLAVAYAKETLNKEVIVVGFSAGGHLAFSVATLNEEKVVKEVLGERDCKPNGVILGYPVIISDEDYVSDSIKGISKGDKEIIELLSLEKRVTKDTPPTFIWTTADDRGVPSENSLKLALELRKNKVNFELHVFEHGMHGLALATIETASKGLEDKMCLSDVAKWFDLSVDFIRRNFNK